MNSRLPRRASASAPVGLAAVLGLALACGPSADAPPKSKPNPDWSLMTLELGEGLRLVRNFEPRERLEVDRVSRPPAGARLLFWDFQPVSTDEAGRAYVADTDESRILLLDERLRPIAWRRPTGAAGERLNRPALVSAFRHDTLAAFETSGAIVIFDLWGRTFRRWDGPFDPAAGHVGAWTPDGGLLLSRSPVLFRFNPVAPGDPLLVWVPAPGGAPVALDTVNVPPPDFWYSGVAWNAGTVAADSAGALYFAWLARPEIRKYDRSGRPVWISQRRVPIPVEVPRLVLVGEGQRPKLRLHTVHKAIAFGPDGLLYARAAADTTGRRDRLEVIDPETGEWLRSAPLDTGTAVLVGPRGRVFETDPAALTAAPEPERRPFPAYALETPAGDTVRLEDARGRTLIVAFWASWCAPCREELPLLDTLYRNTPRAQLEVHAISDDVDLGAARRFAESLDLSFPVLLGRGAMRERYRYQGLPYSALVDREGRLVREFYGFGGREDFLNKVVPRVRQEMEAR